MKEAGPSFMPPGPIEASPSFGIASPPSPVEALPFSSPLPSPVSPESTVFSSAPNALMTSAAIDTVPTSSRLDYTGFGFSSPENREIPGPVSIHEALHLLRVRRSFPEIPILGVQVGYDEETDSNGRAIFGGNLLLHPYALTHAAAMGTVSIPGVINASGYGNKDTKGTDLYHVHRGAKELGVKPEDVLKDAQTFATEEISKQELFSLASLIETHRDITGEDRMQKLFEIVDFESGNNMHTPTFEQTRKHQRNIPEGYKRSLDEGFITTIDKDEQNGMLVVVAKKKEENKKNKESEEFSCKLCNGKNGHKEDCQNATEEQSDQDNRFEIPQVGIVVVDFSIQTHELPKAA